MQHRGAKTGLLGDRAGRGTPGPETHGFSGGAPRPLLCTLCSTGPPLSADQISPPRGENQWPRPPGGRAGARVEPRALGDRRVWGSGRREGRGAVRCGPSEMVWSRASKWNRFVPLSPETVTGSPTLPSSHLPGALAPTVHGPESAAQGENARWSRSADLERGLWSEARLPEGRRHRFCRAEETPGSGFRRAGGWLVGGAVRALSRFFRPGGQG